MGMMKPSPRDSIILKPAARSLSAIVGSLLGGAALFFGSSLMGAHPPFSSSVKW
jgi:hypothetical protein